MSTLRINLHIRPDVSPKLHQALSQLPARPRAELLRKVAEIGLTATVPRSSDIYVPSHPQESTRVSSSLEAEGSLGNDVVDFVEKGLL